MMNSRKPIGYILLITCLVLILSISGGCTGPEEPENTFLELLGLMPAGLADNDPIILLDYEKYRQDNNISVYSENNSLIDVEEYMNLMSEDEIGRSLMGMGEYITGYESANISMIRESNVGYSAASIDAEIHNYSPPYIKVAAIGRFDTDAIESAFANQVHWPEWLKDLYTGEKYTDYLLYSWGSGYELHLQGRLKPPHLDIIGRAKPLAIDDRLLFSAPEVRDVKHMIKASRDEVPNYLDLPRFVTVAEKMHELDAYAAIICYDLWANGGPWEEYEELIEADTGSLLKKFRVLGFGPGRDERGTYMALVLVHWNAGDADANVVLLKERINNAVRRYGEVPWNTVITDTEIYTDNEVLTAKLYTESALLWVHWLFTTDTLLLHER